jgi:hypothetical protein
MSVVVSDEEQLTRACEHDDVFPFNSIRSITSQQHLKGYQKRLNDHAGRLFWKDGEASLDIWEYNEGFAGSLHLNGTLALSNTTTSRISELQCL